MYYAVLRKEIVIPGYCGGTLTRRVGGVYQLEFDNAYSVVKYRCVDLMSDTPEAYGPWEEMSIAEGREHFARSYIDLNAAVEASFLVCEEVYC